VNVDEDGGVSVAPRKVDRLEAAEGDHGLVILELQDLCERSANGRIVIDNQDSADRGFDRDLIGLGCSRHTFPPIAAGKHDRQAAAEKARTFFWKFRRKSNDGSGFILYIDPRLRIFTETFENLANISNRLASY
jgi:hypothetical protein